ncbi:shikimate dehydrogenase family protein [Rhizobium rhizoryzae]|jgi:shikimate dehydrogenase|uniref:Shikimate dehydrogenase n=2 Tax=Rhizobium rhizoryzae TaxID=451876 RepID=A0A7W6LJ07_9HYPH|nr:shikimate dehydrogenase [Rhizobium rhizoryzae]MBB4145131.1 shikimate dehydrogenase [Rhizobium rhizoryzae]
MINGNTKLIAHLGYPTHTFKAPLIYNPYFEASGIDAAVVPMGCRPEDYPEFLKLVFRLSNIHGALITMPHKITTVGLLDEVSKNVEVAGACNAVRIAEDGRLIGDMFDGEGFVRGVLRHGRQILGKRAIITGAGGVGSAIAASLAHAGVAEICIFDTHAAMMRELAERLRHHYPELKVLTGSNDPTGFDIVVNATPLGMKDGDPLPFEVERISPDAFVGEVVLKQEITPFLAAVRARGCDFQVGVDMLFEQIPAYLEFFGFPTTTAEHLRELAAI